MIQPYVGQPVHFVDGERHLAALVVWVWDGANVVNLNVQDPGVSYPTETPVLAQHSIPHDEETMRAGTWHFIEKQFPEAGTIDLSQSINIGANHA